MKNAKMQMFFILLVKGIKYTAFSKYKILSKTYTRLFLSEFTV